jgi:hypothetical protein
LQQDHRPCIQERRRYTRGLACAGRGRQHEGATPCEVSTDLAQVCVDRKWLEA